MYVFSLRHSPQAQRAFPGSDTRRHSDRRREGKDAESGEIHCDSNCTGDVHGIKEAGTLAESWGL